MSYLSGPAPLARPTFFAGSIDYGAIEQPRIGMGFIETILAAVGAIGPALMPILGGDAAARDQKRAERAQLALEAQLREEAATRAQQQQLTLLQLGGVALGVAIVGGAIYASAQVLGGDSKKRTRTTTTTRTNSSRRPR